MNLPPFLNTVLIKLKIKEVDPDETGVEKGYAPYEELDGKKTTTLGMVFVIIMVLAGLWQGETLLSSIQATILPPKSLSSCFYDATSRIGVNSTPSYDYSYGTYSGYQTYPYNDPYYYGNSGSVPSCQYSDIEVKHGFDALYDSVIPDIQTIRTLDQDIANLQSQLWNEKNNKSTNQQNYNTSLIENISKSQNPVYSSSSISSSLVITENRISILTQEINDKTAQKNAKVEAVKQKLIISKQTLNEVTDEYASKLRFLELKRFFTSFILLAPLAWFTMRRYFKAKNTRSQYSIIWGGVALVSSLLFSQVIIVFVYHILPQRLLAEIVQFFSYLFKSFAFVYIIFQWLGFILIPLFFGYLVYKIQKKFYNPLAVAMRAIKEGKCPKCSMKINDEMVHCPMCSYNLRVTCPSCSATSTCFAKFCEKCGKNLPQIGTEEAK